MKLTHDEIDSWVLFESSGPDLVKKESKVGKVDLLKTNFVTKQIMNDFMVLRNFLNDLQ